MIIAIFDSKLLGKIDCILDEELYTIWTIGTLNIPKKDIN